MFWISHMLWTTSLRENFVIEHFDHDFKWTIRHTQSSYSIDSEFYSKYNVELELALIYIPVTQGNGIEPDVNLILTHNVDIYTQNMDFINNIGRFKIRLLISCSNTFGLFSLTHKSNNMSRSHISRHGWNQNFFQRTEAD